MMRNVVIAAILSLGTFAAQADVIAYWAENSNPLPVGDSIGVGAFPQVADYGDQAGAASILPGGGDILANDGTDYDWLHSFTGSTVNAQFGESAGGSLALQGGTSSVNNGAYIDFSFDGASYADIAFSLAARRTGTGFNSVDIYAYDGGTLLGTIASNVDFTSSTTLAVYSYTTSLLDGIANAKIRMTFDGATSSTGNNRLDNMLISGTLVPEPASLVLIGLAGLIVRRR